MLYVACIVLAGKNQLLNTLCTDNLSGIMSIEDSWVSGQLYTRKSAVTSGGFRGGSLGSIEPPFERKK